MNNIIFLFFSTLFLGSQAVDWKHLTNETLHNLTDSVFANATSIDINSIPPNACVGFRESQIRSLNVSAVPGITDLCMENIPPEAVAGFNSSQIEMLSPDGACVGLISVQLLKIQPKAYRGFQGKCVKNFESSCAGFYIEGISNLTLDAVSGIQSNCMVNIPQNATFGFSPAQVSVFSNSTCQSITSQQMSNFNPISYSGFTMTCVNNFDSSCAGFTKNGISYLQNTTIKSISKFCMENIPFTAVSGFSKSQISFFSTDIGSGACYGLTSAQMRNFNSEYYSGFTSACVYCFDEETCSGFTEYGFSNLSISAVANISSGCMLAIPGNATQSLSAQQVSAFSTDINGGCYGITREQLEHYPDVAYSGFTMGCIAKLGDNAECAGITPSGIIYVNPHSISGLNYRCMGEISPDTFRNITIQQIGNLSYSVHGACVGITARQLQNSLRKQIDAFKNPCISQWDPQTINGMPVYWLRDDQCTAFTTYQVSLFNSTTIGEFSLAQISKFSNFGIFGLKPFHLAILYNKYMKEFISIFSEEQSLYLLSCTIEFKYYFQNKTVTAILKANDTILANISKIQWITFTAIIDDEVGKVLTIDSISKLIPSAIIGLRVQQLPNLKDIVFEKLTNYQASYLLNDTLSAMNAGQYAAIPPSSFSAINPLFIKYIPLEVIPYLTVKQLQGMTCNQVRNLTNDQIKQISSTQANVFNSRLGVCIGSPTGTIDSVEFIHDLYIALGVSGAFAIVIIVVGLFFLGRKKRRYSYSPINK